MKNNRITVILLIEFFHRFYLWSLSNDSRRKNARELSLQSGL